MDCVVYLNWTRAIVILPTPCREGILILRRGHPLFDPAPSHACLLNLDLRWISLHLSFLLSLEMLYPYCEASLCRTIFLSSSHLRPEMLTHGVTHNWEFSSLWCDCAEASEKERYELDLGLSCECEPEHKRIKHTTLQASSPRGSLRKTNVTKLPFLRVCLQCYVPAATLG